MADGAKIGRQRLNRGFVGGFIEQNNAALGVARAMQACQIMVETAGQLFKGELDRINRRNFGLVHHAGEKPVARMRLNEHFERVFDGCNTVFFGKLAENTFAVCIGLPCNSTLAGSAGLKRAAMASNSLAIQKPWRSKTQNPAKTKYC